MDNMDVGLDDFGDLNFDQLGDLGRMEDFTLGDFDEQMNFELETPPSPIIVSAHKKQKEPISPANSEVKTPFLEGTKLLYKI